MKKEKNTKIMKKRTKYIIGSVVLGIFLLIAIISLMMRDNFSTINSDEDFVVYHLTYLDEGASDIYFLEATLYFNDDDAFLEINYDYSYLGIERTTRYLVNRHTGQFVNGGYEQSYPEFMKKFNDTKANYTTKIVYSTLDIDGLLRK